MANTINKASSAALHTTVQNYYDGKLLMEMEKRLVYYQGGQRRSLPKGSGRVAEFWRYEPFDAVTTALTEGVVPDGQTLSMSKVTAEVKAYGGYVATTDVLDLTGVNTQTNQLVHLMARQGALSVDHIVRDVIFGGTNAMYCGKKAARDAVTAADKLTVEDIRRAVRKLERRRAQVQPKRQGVLQVHHRLGREVLAAGRRAVGGQGQISAGGADRKRRDRQAVRRDLHESSEAPVYAKAGASAADVGAALVFGEDAYGVVDLGVVGASPVRTIVKPLGSAGTADPLDQMATIGWKVDGFAAVILNQNWLVRVEHAIEA